MKKSTCLLLFLFSAFSFGQNLSNTFRFSPEISSVNLEPFSFQLSLNKSHLSKSFTVYNRYTNLNDHYYTLGENYYKSTVKSFSLSNFNGQRIDSFNPTGATSLGGALLVGTINSLLRKH